MSTLVRPFPRYLDSYIPPTGLQVGATITRYPFASAQTPDAYPREHTRTYICEKARACRLGERSSYSSGLTYTDDFSNAAWTKANVTATANILANPNDGALTGSRLLETSATDVHNVSQNYTFASTASHVFTVFLSALGRDWIRLRVYDGTVDHDAWFNLSTGATNSSLTTSLVQMPRPGHAWWRATMVITPTSAAAGGVAIACSPDGSTVSYAGDTAKGVYIDRANIRPGTITTIGPAVGALGTARTVSCPDLDPDDCFAYLAAETDSQAMPGDLARVERTFARIPGTQTIRDWRSFARPNPTGLKSSSTFAAQIRGEAGSEFCLWTSRKAVQGTITSQGTTVYNTLQSGTVTLTLTGGAGSGTFDPSNTQATIDAALKAALVGATKLSGISVAKSADNSTITISWTRWVGGPDIDSGTTGISVPSGIDVIRNGNFVQFKAFGTTITPDTKLIRCDAHGAGVGEACGLYNGDVLVATGSVSGISDDNRLSIVMSDLQSPDFNITHLVLFDDAAFRYAAGERSVRIKVARDYYLPGVTSVSGTTLADLDSLPAVTTYKTAQRWLDRIVAAATTVPIDASELGTYLGPIATRDTVSVVMDSTTLESL